MNPEQLYDGMTEIRDDLIEEPVSPRKPEPKKPWARWLLSAAAILAVVYLGSVMLGGTAGGGGGQGGQTYMAYHGPVFPLDVLEDTALTASRRTDYDFSPMTGEIDHSYVDQYGETVHYQYGGYEVIVTDSYTLTNDTDRDVTVTAVYPFAASLDDDMRVMPRITVDGTAAETDLRIGAVSEALRSDGSWERYRDLLEDGSYSSAALCGNLRADQPVVIYQIVGAEALEEAVAPTLQFTAEPAEGSFLLSYGSKGGMQDSAHGGIIREFGIRKRGAAYTGSTQCVIVLGADILDYSVQCYRDGSCDYGKEIEAQWNVLRQETTLLELLDLFYSDYGPVSGENRQTILNHVPDKILLGQMMQFMALHGPEAADYPGRNLYDDLTDLFTEVENGMRVMYLTFPLTVPAHGQTEVSIAMHKQGHTDYTGRGAQRQGYDLVTRLGSSLTFTEQLASLSNFENFTILRQNFGFDPKHGVTTVLLDSKVDHYWMDVRKQ